MCSKSIVISNQAVILLQVQFNEWQSKKSCTIIINDDSIFEGRETFYVELLQPSLTLPGTVLKTSITIEDMEDGWSTHFYVSKTILPMNCRNVFFQKAT